MKDYINVFHAIVSEIHFWDNLNYGKKELIVSKFLENLPSRYNEYKPLWHFNEDTRILHG